MVKLGKPLPTIPEDYTEPIPDAVDFAQLVALWNEYAPRKYRGILEAKPIEDRTEIKSKWYWDQAAREYVSARGLRVPVRELQQATRDFVKAWTSA